MIYLFVALAAGLFVEGVYLLFFSDARRIAGTINRRLQLLEGPARPREHPGAAAPRARADRAAATTGSALDRAQPADPAVRADARASASSRSIVAVGALLAFGLALVFTRDDLLEAFGAALFCGTLLPFLVLRFMRGRRQKTFGAQFPDALDIIVRSLRAGHPVPVAITMVAREMADPIGSEFGIVADEITYGADLETGMRNLYFRIGQDDLPLFVTAVAIQGSTGGNLGEILRKPVRRHPPALQDAAQDPRAGRRRPRLGDDPVVAADRHVLRHPGRSRRTSTPASGTRP